MSDAFNFQRVVVSLILSLLLIITFCIPTSFIKAISSPLRGIGRIYPLSLGTEGNENAGIKGYEFEYAYLKTSEWTTLIGDLEDGNSMLRVDMINIPGTGTVDKYIREQNGIQNLSIDFTVDMRGRILSANYNEIGGYAGELFYVYDNLGNVCALTNNQGNIVTAYGYNVMNGVVESEFNPNSVENPFTFGGAVKIGNNDANVAPEGGSTFVVDPNLSAVTLGKNVIALGTGCFSGTISDEMGRVIDGPSFEEVNEALRELAQRDGFAMWCPGQLCAITPCSAIIGPEGCEEEDDDDMYPDKVGGSRVDEHGPYKNRKECFSYCNKEIGPSLLEGLGLGFTSSVITNILNLGRSAFSSIGLQYAIMTALSGVLGWKVLVGFALARLIWVYGGCAYYCVKNYK